MGASFDGQERGEQAHFVDTSLGVAPYTQQIQRPSGVGYRWRVRLRYDPTASTGGMVTTRWFYPVWGTPGLADFLGGGGDNVCAVAADCDDGNACNGAETCQAGTCRAGTPCNDGQPCTVSDACRGGMCFGTTKDCSALNDGCAIGACHPSTGACIRLPPAAGVLCPFIASTPNMTFLLGVPYHYDENDRPEANGAEGITWQLVEGPAGMTVESDGAIRWIPTVQGPVTMRLRATNSSGAAVQSATLSRRNPAPPAIVDDANRVATLGQPYLYNAASAVILEGVDPDEVLEVAVLQGPTGFVANPATHSVGWLPHTNGAFPVTLALRSVAEALPWDALEFTINVGEASGSLPIAAAANITPTSGRAPLAVRFDASGSHGTDNTAIIQYLWDLGNGDVRLLKTSELYYVYDKPVGLALTLRIRDALGFSATTKVFVSAETPHGLRPSMAQLEADRLSGQAPLTVHFSCNCDDPDGDSTALTYYWQLGAAATSDAKSFDYTFEEPGTYLVRLTVQDEQGLFGCDSAIVSVQTTEQLMAPLARIVVVNNDRDSPAEVTYVASAEDPDGVVTAQPWRFDDGTVSDALQVIKTYAEAGTYDVRLEVEDNDGFVGYDHQRVYVRSQGKLPPRIVSQGSSGAVVGQSYHYDLDDTAAAQGTRPITWLLGKISNRTTFNAPSGMTLNPKTVRRDSLAAWSATRIVWII